MEDIELHQLHIAQIAQELVDANPQVLVTSFSTAPEKLDTGEIPALYSLTSSATRTNQFGEREEYLTRVYRVQVAVVPTGQATPTEREKLCRDLLEKVRKQFNRFPRLNDCNGVFTAKVIGDSGVVILPEFGMKFVGFEIRLQVTYVDVIDFAENE